MKAYRTACGGANVARNTTAFGNYSQSEVFVAIRKLPAVNERVETGAVQFGDDWPGVFIRGDSAKAISLELFRIMSLLSESDLTLHESKDGAEQTPNSDYAAALRAIDDYRNSEGHTGGSVDHLRVYVKQRLNSAKAPNCA